MTVDVACNLSSRHLSTIMFTGLLLVISAVPSLGQQGCQQTNVRYNGETQRLVKTRSVDLCQAECQAVKECRHWTYNRGECDLKRATKPGDKVGLEGAVTGERTCDKNKTVEAVKCHYTDTNQDIMCLFPFYGDNPGRKSTGGSRHDTCVKTKRGHYWCATKLSADNRLIGTSVQNRDVNCEQNRNKLGEFYCAASGSTKTSSKQSSTARSTASKTSKVTSKPLNKLAITTTKSKNSKSPTKTTRFSCLGRCGQTAGLGECQCASGCKAFGDCCSDYSQTCQDTEKGTKQSKPSAGPQIKIPSTTSSRPKQSTSRPFQKTKFPIATHTLNGVSDLELAQFTESLIENDEDNVASLLEVNAGCKTRVGSPKDCSQQPLFSRVDTSIFRKPVYEKLVKLYDNYNASVTFKEDRTRVEQSEENSLLDTLMKSKVITSTLTFLKSKKLFTKSKAEFKKLLTQLWFDVYSRGNRIDGSSGFEHVFLGEKKGGKVQGFHNWVYFYFLEKQDKLNYLGHWENVDLGGKGTGLSFTFKWGEEQKPYASMLVGTSPEFDMALYTTCLLARGEEDCRVSLGGRPVTVTTHVFTRPRGVRYIASAFVDWK